jgi:hypothetical protein
MQRRSRVDPPHDASHASLPGEKFDRRPLRLAENRRRRAAPGPGTPPAPVPRRSAPEHAPGGKSLPRDVCAAEERPFETVGEITRLNGDRVVVLYDYAGRMSGVYQMTER